MKAALSQIFTWLAEGNGGAMVVCMKTDDPLNPDWGRGFDNVSLLEAACIRIVVGLR